MTAVIEDSDDSLQITCVVLDDRLEHWYARLCRQQVRQEVVRWSVNLVWEFCTTVKGVLNGNETNTLAWIGSKAESHSYLLTFIVLDIWRSCILHGAGLSVSVRQLSIWRAFKLHYKIFTSYYELIFSILKVCFAISGYIVQHSDNILYNIFHLCKIIIRCVRK